MGIVWLIGCAADEPAERPTPEEIEAPTGIEAPVHAAPPAPPEIVSIHAGESVTCVRTDDSVLRCTGVSAPLEIPLPLGPEVSAIEVTERAICLRSPGLVRCLREGIEETEPTGMVEVVRGPGAAVGRDANGGVWAFREEREEGSALVPIVLPRPALRVVSGGQGPCALLDDGDLWCWDPYTAMLRSPTPRRIAQGVRAIDGSYLQICWITEDRAYCRADGAPVAISGVAHPDAIAVGRAHACALQSGVPLCWGDDSRGQRAGGKGREASLVSGIEGALSIDAGSDHSCVLLHPAGERASALCWGAGRGRFAIP